MRIGIGFDVHRLVGGRKLILGGVEIPFEKGLLGHSDADVLLHAIMDALLGAAGLGDIGFHFPDTDLRFKNCDSLILLKEVNHLIASQGYGLENLDTVIMAEQPKISPYIAVMRHRIGTNLSIAPELISIKATTTEQLGFVGRGEGIAAQAVALLRQC